MSSEHTSKKPVRESQHTIDHLPENLTGKVTVPSVGFDFGSYYIRVAIIDHNEQQKIRITLATYAADDFEAALHHATHHLSTHDGVSVYYTGHDTEEKVASIKKEFAKAKVIQRRDKLDSHNFGANLLISALQPEEIFHDTTEFEKKSAGPPFKPELMGKLFPEKMIEYMISFIIEVQASKEQTFPIMLSIGGNNNIICKIEENGTYEAAYAGCTGGHFLKTLWNFVGHPEHVTTYDHLLELASKGERRKIDAVTNEILDFVGFYAMMPRDFPVFTFGKMHHINRENVTPEDLARATVALTLDTQFSKLLEEARLLHTYNVYFTGSLIQHDFVRNQILERGEGFGPMGAIKPKFFKSDATAALGACVGSE